MHLTLSHSMFLLPFLFYLSILFYSYLSIQLFKQKTSLIIHK